MEQLNKGYTAGEYAEFADMATKAGKILEQKSDGSIGMKAAPVLPEPGYAEKRAAEYPPIGDMVDAICKAQGGSSAELDTLLAKRNEIKAKYPKEQIEIYAS
jgi:hypothetical protein